MNEIENLIKRVDLSIPSYPDTELITVHKGHLEGEINGLIKAIAEAVEEEVSKNINAIETYGLHRAVDIIRSFGGNADNEKVKGGETSEKYKNPDKRCKYPYQPDGINYCWGYAVKVDAKASKKEIERFCSGCEFWNNTPPLPTDREKGIFKKPTRAQCRKLAETLKKHGEGK